MAANKDTIALAVKIAGRAAASREVQTLRKDLTGVGQGAQQGAKQAEGALGKVQQSVKKTGDEAERQSPRMAKASKPLATIARRAAAAGAALLSVKAANDAVATLEDLGSAAMGLAGNFGMTEDQAGRWAAIAKVRNLAPKALNQSFGTLAKNVEAVGPAADGQASALEKLSKQQQQQLADTDNIENAQKREEKRAKILASFQQKRGDLSSKSLGKQADALKAFGISSSEAASANENMYGFLLKVADGYEKLGPGTNRSALAMSLFGRGWQTLRPLLSKGSEGLKEQLALVDEYGANVAGSTGSLSDHIAQQREQKIAMLGIQVQMGKVLLPLYAKGAELTTKFAKTANKAWPTIEREITPVVETTEKVAEATAKFVEKHPELIKVAAGFVAVATAAKGLKFAGKVTGINSVLKMLWKLRAQSAVAGAEGDVAGRRFVRGWNRQVGKPGAGAAAGASLGRQTGTAAAASASTSMTAPGAITGRSKGRMSSIGGALGKTLGVAMAGFALNQFAHDMAGAGVQDIWDKLRRGVGADGAPGTGNALPKNRGKSPSAKAVAEKDAASPQADLALRRDRAYNAWVNTGAEAHRQEYLRLKRRIDRSRGRVGGGVVQPGETTLVGERGPEVARFPPGTEIFPTNHPWTQASKSGGEGPARRAAASGGSRQSDQAMILNRIYIDGRVLYEAFSTQHEREALKR